MPIPVKTLPRFKCVHCQSYRATLPAVEKHEGICWQNPNRFCPACENTGVITFQLEGAGGHYGEASEPCHYCLKEDKEVTANLKRHKVSADPSVR